MGIIQLNNGSSCRGFLVYIWSVAGRNVRQECLWETVEKRIDECDDDEGVWRKKSRIVSFEEVEGVVVL